MIARKQQFDHVIGLLCSTFIGKKRIGGAPTASHSMRVGLSLMARGYEHEIVMAGFCHDLLEDSHLTSDALEGFYGSEVRFLVVECSFCYAEVLETEAVAEARLNQDVIALARDGEVRPLIIKCEDALDNLKELRHLKREFQLKGIASAEMRLAAARELLEEDESNNGLLQDLEHAIARERMRLEYAT